MKSSTADNHNDIRNGNSQLIVLAGIFSSIGRTTVRTVRNFPTRVRNGIKRRINEYKRRPVRKDINKVYVLVGYTTKQHIDERYNAERMMIIIRRGLLLLIFVLLLFISINAILPYVKTDEYSQMFGISSVDEMTENDPFVGKTEDDAESDDIIESEPTQTDLTNTVSNSDY